MQCSADQPLLQEALQPEDLLSIEICGGRCDGDYKVEWQGTGPEIQVNFVRDGKTVATVPGTLKTNDPQVVEDDIVIETTSANTKTLKEIDFGHNKESLVFEQGGM